MQSRWILSSTTVSFLLACKPLGVAPYGPKPKGVCPSEVAFLDADVPISQPHREVGQRIVTCKAWDLAVCRAFLMDWACALRVDAVIIETVPAGGNPKQQLVGRSGRAIRYTPLCHVDGSGRCHPGRGVSCLVGQSLRNETIGYWVEGSGLEGGGPHRSRSCRD